jgi:hypothetical protein
LHLASENPVSKCAFHVHNLHRYIVDHLLVFPEAVVVIEEYDKMGCPARG